MSARDVTLDDFWRGRTRLASLAAQLLTLRTDAADSIWRGDPYGSSLAALVSTGGSAALVRRELERVLAVTDAGGAIESLTDHRAVVRTLDARLAITADAVAEDA